MNKDLKNDFYSLPKELLLHLNDNLKNSNDSQSGFKRLKGMCDQKGMGYTQAKKVKHEMENGMEPQVYKLIGGDELLSWINDKLDRRRDIVDGIKRNKIYIFQKINFPYLLMIN